MSRGACHRVQRAMTDVVSLRRAMTALALKRYRQIGRLGCSWLWRRGFGALQGQSRGQLPRPFPSANALSVLLPWPFASLRT
jgi:hypothetical protein